MSPMKKTVNLDGDHFRSPPHYTIMPPSADFSASPLSGRMPLEVSFTDESSGCATAWSWMFEDKRKTVHIHDKNPTYIFKDYGKYDVSLTAYEYGKSVTTIKYDCITVLSNSWYIPDVTTLEYTGNSMSDDVYAQTRSINFNEDGTILLVTDGTWRVIRQYELSNPWDLSNPTLINTSNTLSNVDFLMQTKVSPNGEVLMMLDLGNDRIYQYNFGTPWDVSTLTYHGDYPSSSPMPYTHHVFDMCDDGIHMYIEYTPYRTIYQYELGTAWDLTSAAYTGKNIPLDHIASDFIMNRDGDQFVIVDSNRIRTYDVTIPYDISSIAFVDEFVPARAPVTAIYIKEDSSNLYVVNTGQYAIDEYAIPPID